METENRQKLTEIFGSGGEIRTPDLVVNSANFSFVGVNTSLAVLAIIT